MQVLSVYAHHEPSSMTASLQHTADQILRQQGHTIITSDLYAMNWQAAAQKWDFATLSGKHFNYRFEQKIAAKAGDQFAPDILGEIQKLKAADLILFHFPLWWGAPPAILKGWLDRVMAMGVAWDGEHVFENGLLHGKKALVVVTAGSPESFYTPAGQQKGSLTQLLKPLLHSTLAYCGIKVLQPYFVYGLTTAAEPSLKEEIEKFSKRIANIENEQQFLRW